MIYIQTADKVSLMSADCLALERLVMTEISLTYRALGGPEGIRILWFGNIHSHWHISFGEKTEDHFDQKNISNPTENAFNVK